jgi:hypothetical protein
LLGGRDEEQAKQRVVFWSIVSCNWAALVVDMCIETRETVRQAYLRSWISKTTRDVASQNRLVTIGGTTQYCSMATPQTSARPEQPHLVSLVLQSKKALQHGEQLCSRANTLSSASAQCAIDVLALDAKVRWITDAVIEQLKVQGIVLCQSFLPN